MMTRDYAAPDWRGLCEELAGWIERSTQHYIQDPDVLIRAYAALDQPEPEVVEPTDQELKTFACEWWSKFGFAKDKATCTWAIAEIDPVHFADFSRDLLARYGRPAPASAGEVGELVDRLRRASDGASAMGWEQDSWTIARAADLLERQAAPVPVAVSERLPEAGDCLGRPTEDSDAGWCWTYSGALEVWRFQSVVFPRPYPEPPRVTLSPSVTHWLPHHALPLPSGEAIAAELEGAG